MICSSYLANTTTASLCTIITHLPAFGVPSSALKLPTLYATLFSPYMRHSIPSKRFSATPSVARTASSPSLMLRTPSATTIPAQSSSAVTPSAPSSPAQTDSRPCSTPGVFCALTVAVMWTCAVMHVSTAVALTVWFGTVVATCDTYGWKFSR